MLKVRRDCASHLRGCPGHTHISCHWEEGEVIEDAAAPRPQSPKAASLEEISNHLVASPLVDHLRQMLSSRAALLRLQRDPSLIYGPLSS